MYQKGKGKYQKPRNVPSSLKKWKTGEDIDLLRESNQRLRSDSVIYKDDIDGA